MMMEYLTDKDFEIAAENGISRANAIQRFYTYGFSKERAITERVKTKTLLGTWRPVLAITKVSESTFYRNMKVKGMTPFEAATTAPKKIGREKNTGKLTEEHIKIAEANGIPRQTVMSRVYTYVPKWDVQRAITEPVNTKFISRGKSYA